MYCKNLSIVSLLTAAIALSVSSASIAFADSTLPDDLIVTATRTPAPEEQVLAPVLTITRADIERSLATDVADLLRFQAGLDIGRNGGPGQPASVFLRGTDSNHTVVLIDGVRINPGTLGGAPLENIAPESIERIEVVKGPRSTLYGSDAIGGVVNIFTRGAHTKGIEAFAGYGRYDTRAVSASGGLQSDRGGIGFSAYLLDSSGFPSLAGSDVDRGYRNDSFTLQGRWQAGPVELRARGWSSSGTTQYSDFLLTPVDEDFDNQAAALEAAFAARDNWRMRVATTLMQNDLAQNQSADRIRTRRYSVEWQNDLTLSEHNALTFGALASREHVVTAQFGSGLDVDTDVVLAYVEDRFDHGRHHALIAGGYTDHDTAGGKATWNIDYGYDIGRRLRMLAAAGTAYRAPDSTDRFGFGGNPDLAPESSRNIEVGLQFRRTAHERFRLSVFHNDIDNLITFVVTDPVTFDGVNKNVERARIAGIEASYGINAAGWQLQVAGSLQDPRNVSEDTQLLRRTRASLSLSVVRAFDRYQLGLDVLTAGARQDFGFPSPVTLAPYTLVDLTARVSLTPLLDINARLENALDERYQLAEGYNTPRRGIFVAARYRFGGAPAQSGIK
jgi:vitamin B12 transporter